MQALIWTGSALTLIGVAMLIYCIVFVVRSRAAGLEDAALRQRLQRAVAMNMAALALSGLGLAVVITGLALG